MSTEQSEKEVVPEQPVKVENVKASTPDEKPSIENKEDSRDESESVSRKPKVEDRDYSASEASEHQSSKQTQSKPSPSRKSRSSGSSIQSPQRSYMSDNYPPSYSRGPYPPHPSMHGAPRAPPPAAGPYGHPHYYGGAPHDPYRAPHPHYHQMPPLPHPGQYGAPYCPPPNMAGRPGPPPGYHPYAPHSYAPPHMGYHGGPPPSFPPPGHPMSGPSDNHSISSGKSKGSHVSRSTKGSHGVSKKRTIDGVHESNEMSHEYAFRRTNSNASSNSTVTASNNDHHPLTHESPRKRERSNSHNSQNSRYPSAVSNNIFDEDRFRHRRNPSGASSASSLSAGGFSLQSYDGPRRSNSEAPMMKASPKRRRGADEMMLEVDTGVDSRSRGHRRIPSPTDSAIEGPESSRFGKLSMNDNDKNREESGGNDLFMSLSTSPINHPEVDATPISKNTKKGPTKITIKTQFNEEDEAAEDESKPESKPSPFRKSGPGRPIDTPTPPGALADTEMMGDGYLLNRHLRGQTFTPLAHLGEQPGISPSNAGFNTINATLSWSIAGDTPSLEDLAACSWEEHDKSATKRPGSTTSQLSASSREMVISPHNFSLWKEEHETVHKKEEESKDNDTVRLSILSPHSEIGIPTEGVSGTTTPLPLFFGERPGSEERENEHHSNKHHHSKGPKDGETEHIHNMFVNNAGRGSAMKPYHPSPHYSAPPTPGYVGSHQPPTPLYAASSVGFAQSPLHGDGRDHRMMFGHPPPPHGHNDRVRNLRGRVPPGGHLPPMPLHIPPHVSSHHPLTSPMALGQHGKPMWSPHHSMPPMASPHHMSTMDMTQSKRKCVPIKPPIPSKFQGDMEKMKGASVPEFTSLVNFPAHMSQKQSVNLPEGMRCCVMCGQACPCSTGAKKKGAGGKSDGSLAPRSSNGQDPMGDKGYAIIPTQNKGLCTLCDVNVWIVVNSGLEIKWCKGCKNFRPWAAFGDKGLATKCLRCRERQREKYALQKEEKERTRVVVKGKAKA
eukprot:Nitzschia sp. Nitz4//scaffold13_size275219//108262//111350//NITZ4_000866-RA/size275219-processed-gene-0.151-mRNA-1//-1//CDS//3329535990//8274//frame0